MKYQAVCFDFDYTLGDCTDSIVAGFQYGLTGLGWPAPDRDSVRKTVGYLLEDSYTMLTGDKDEANRAKFRLLFLEVAMERQRRETVLFPGAIELLHGLKEKGIKLGIVSTKRSDTLEIILERYGVLKDMELVIGSDRVKAHKPEPEGLNAAAQLLDVPKENILFCGDTILDAGAAKNAGMDFAAVLNGTTPGEAFKDWPYVRIVNNLWELKDWLDELL